MSRYNKRRKGTPDNYDTGISSIHRGSLRLDTVEKKPAVTLQPMADLDLMIANGWGDTPQRKLPRDWRTRTLPRNPNIGSTGPKPAKPRTV